MIVPALYTWIEKGDELATDGIQGGDIGHLNGCNRSTTTLDPPGH
jgi:hypothetical protein